MSRTFAILVVCSLLPVAAIAAEPAAQPNTIRVVAQATVAVKPDQAQFELGVTTAKKTAAAAVSENEHKMEQVLVALKKEIGTDGEVNTSGISVYPRYEETKGGQTTARVLGYTVTNTVAVRVTNIKAVGKILDAAVQAGANTINSVQFTLKDPEAAQNQALRAASAKAKARAAAMAEAQGLRVGEVIFVSEGDFEIPFDKIAGNLMARRAAVGALAAMPVEAGSVEVSASVTVLFALKAR